jgi:RecA-family ATPase
MADDVRDDVAAGEDPSSLEAGLQFSLDARLHLQSMRDVLALAEEPRRLSLFTLMAREATRLVEFFGEPRVEMIDALSTIAGELKVGDVDQQQAAIAYALDNPFNPPKRLNGAGNAHHDEAPPPIEEEPPAPPRKLTEVLGDSFEGQPVPKREWLVTGFVPANTVTLLTGDGGVGKSQVALQLAAATAAGSRWLGKYLNGGRSLVLSAEDDIPEIHRRLDSIVKGGHGVAWSDLAQMKIVPLVGEDAVLGLADGRSGAIKPTELFHIVVDLAAAWEPQLIVIDSLHDAFAGEENSRTQARQFIGLLRGLALKARSAIVVLAHPSLSGIASGSGMSGSTAWSNAVRSRLYLSRNQEADEDIQQDPNVRVLQVMKANYASTGERITVRWTDGVFVAEDEHKPTFDLAAERRAIEVFLDLLDTYAKEGRPVSASPSATFAPTLFAADHRSRKASKVALQHAMNVLLEKGEIQVEEFGPPSKRRSRLVHASNALPSLFQRPSNGGFPRSEP